MVHKVSNGVPITPPTAVNPKTRYYDQTNVANSKHNKHIPISLVSVTPYPLDFLCVAKRF